MALLDKLAAIEARVEKATPGPWQWEPHQTEAGVRYQHVLAIGTGLPDNGICDTYHADPIGVGTTTEEPDPENEDHWTRPRHGKKDDATFIAACRTDIPKLIAKLRQLVKAVEAMHKERNEMLLWDEKSEQSEPRWRAHEALCALVEGGLDD